MTVCGHQFHGIDGSDWVFSTSVGCLDGSTTASKILQELFKKHCRSLKSENSRKRLKTLKTNSENISRAEENKTHSKNYNYINDSEETLIVRKMPGTSILENFDESQHLNGCPMKWLYNKKLLEKNKRFKMGRLCTQQSPRKDETKKVKNNNNLRDKTPVEVKIHKINLTEKYTGNSEDNYTGENLKDFQERRKKLAAKLNWKLHDESQDDHPLDTVSDTGSRHDYFPPRPLLGLKPLLTVLLAPQRSNCSCLETQLKANIPPVHARKPSLSIQSLDFSFPPKETNLRPKTTNALRWGYKTIANTKKLQIPNQITIKLDQKKGKSPEVKNKLKIVYYNPPTKKVSERRKQTKSLSSLFYELKGKANENEEYFEELMRDLTTEGQFKIKRFFHFDHENFNSVRKYKTTADKREKLTEDEFSSSATAAAVGNESNLLCGKVRIFKKISPKENKNKENETSETI